MICPRCLLRASFRPSRPQSTRTSSPTSLIDAATRITTRSFTTTRSSSTPESTLTTTPSTTPDHPSGAPHPSPTPKAQPTTSAPRIASSVAAGTVLRGLNYFKNKPDPVALEDGEYPAWLWTVLGEKKKGPAEGQKEEMDPRLFSKSAKARRMANKRLRKEAQLHPGGTVQKVPLYEQTIDLPAVGEEAQKGREDLTKAMRKKRRRDIKEANFLKGMS